MIGVTVRADTRVLDLLIADLESAPVRFNALVDNIVKGRGGYIQRAERELTPYPGAPKRPIRWKSQRQRRAYFASNGFGRGIPSRRTNKLKKSWRFVYRPLRERGGDASLTIENTDPKARFVIGANQQPFHADTGWIRLDRSPVIPKLQKDLTSDLSEIWVNILARRR